MTTAPMVFLTLYRTPCSPVHLMKVAVNKGVCALNLMPCRNSNSWNSKATLIRILMERTKVTICWRAVGRKYRSGGGIALTSRWRGTLDDGGGGVQVLRLLVLAIAAIFRSKALLIAENLCLRQQLVVLPRRHPRPRLSGAIGAFHLVPARRALQAGATALS
jgi:choline dehydrogenase-like flavoprotein